MNFSQIQTAKRILIFGYGLEGKSSHNFLQKHFPNTFITIYDDNIEEWKEVSPLEEFDIIVVTPGISRIRIPEELHSRCTSNTEIFFNSIPEEKRRHIIGISGTKGKSTTTTFTHNLLEANNITSAIGGNAGIPMLDLYDDFIADKYTYIVAELSSFQLEYLTVSPGIAFFLNLYGDHIERHTDLDGYFEAKSNLWRHQKEGDKFYLSIDGVTELTNRGVKNFTLCAPIARDLIPTESTLQAQHFLNNLGTTYSFAKDINITDEVISQAATQFKSLEHRLEYVDTKNNIDFYNDSISTTPHSTVAAIAFFKEKLGSLILGGVTEGADYKGLLQSIDSLSHQTQVVLIQSSVADMVQKASSHPNLHHVKTVQEAVEFTLKHAPKDSVCLFSPSGKSFDQFKNYKERGNVFKGIVLDS